MQQAGLHLPTVVVEWRGLTVEADALVGAAAQPSISNALKGCLRTAACQGGLKRRRVTLLHGLNGVLQPGTLTLLLGPPGAGKSLFLRALAGRLRASRGARVSGSVRFNGVEGEAFELRRTVALVEQEDWHIAALTVRAGARATRPHPRCLPAKTTGSPSTMPRCPDAGARDVRIRLAVPGGFGRGGCP